MEELTITGSFFLSNNDLIISKMSCTLKIDYLNFVDSTISFQDVIASSKIRSIFLHNDIIVFKNKDFYMILKSMRIEFLSLFNVLFQINKLTVLNEFSDKIIYESGLIKSLILKLPPDYIMKNEKFIIRPVYIGGFYYWRIISKEFIELDELSFIFRIISSITASFFTYRMITNSKMQKEYYWKISKSIKFYETDYLKETYNIDFFRLYNNKNQRIIISNILAEYTFSITREDIEYRFFKCMNLLDYIIELSSRRKKNQSVRLKKILNKILTEQEKEHIIKLIPYYNEIKESSNNNKPRIFDFYNYRNSSYHRGFQLINDNDIDVLLYCLYVVNEVLRILISNFDKINFKKKKSVLTIKLIPSVKEIKMITKKLNQ